MSGAGAWTYSHCWGHRCVAGRPVPRDTDKCGSCRVPRVPGSAPGQAEPSLRLQYSGSGAGHRATSGCTVRTEACESGIRRPDWHRWARGGRADYGPWSGAACSCHRADSESQLEPMSASFLPGHGCVDFLPGLWQLELVAGP